MPNENEQKNIGETISSPRPPKNNYVRFLMIFVLMNIFLALHVWISPIFLIYPVLYILFVISIERIYLRFAITKGMIALFPLVTLFLVVFSLFSQGKLIAYLRPNMEMEGLVLIPGAWLFLAVGFSFSVGEAVRLYKIKTQAV